MNRVHCIVCFLRIQCHWWLNDEEVSMNRSAYNYRINCDDATGWQFSWHNDANERNIFMGCYLYIGSRLVSQRTIKVWSFIFRSRMIDPLRSRHILPWMRRILRVLWLRIHVRHKTVRPLSNRPSVIRPKRSTSRRSTATQTWPTSACNVNNGRNLKIQLFTTAKLNWYIPSKSSSLLDF